MYLRLGDDTLLIQGGEDIKVSDGTKVLFKKLPLVIGSRNTVTITKEHEEFIFPSRLNASSMPIGIWVTKLSTMQLHGVKIKAAWDHFVSNLNFADYIEYAALGLQLLFAPLTILGIVMACRNRSYFKRQQKKREKEERKSNFEENNCLLNKKKGSKKKGGK